MLLLHSNQMLLRSHVIKHGRKLPLHPQQRRRPFASSKTSNKNKNIQNSKKEAPPPPNALPKAFAIGSLAGVCGSLAGMGGGFVMIPLMTSSRLLGLSQHQAHGTSLFAVAATGVAGALGYQGQVQYDAAAAIAACGIVTAGFGASVTTRISAVHLKKALGVFMIMVAPLVPLKTYRKGNVAMRVAPALAAGAFCGGYLGGRLGLQVNEDSLRWGFSGLMLTLGIRTLVR